MKKILIRSFHAALENYTKRKSRGYRMGFFSSLRHSFSKTEKLAKLEQALISSSDEDVLSVVIEHLLLKDATFHNHSFNSYLIDELKNTVKHIDWNCFTPKAIKKYQSTTYRGTSQPPQKIFAEGFRELVHSDKVENYLKFKNDSIGISTTKDFQCALEYASNQKRSGRERYIYAINYRGDNGYDILETGKARGLSFSKFLHRHRYSGLRKHEVNIQYNIHNTDVIGAWKLLGNGTLSWIDNPNFQLERERSEEKKEFQLGAAYYSDSEPLQNRGLSI